jgi:gas vesicle protein
MTTATTGIDRLLNLLDEKKDVTLSGAADELGVDKDQVQQWSDFLVENNRVMVNYKFMTPHLTLLDKEGRPSTEDARQLISNIRQQQKKFSTAIKTQDAQSAQDALEEIADLVDDIEDEGLHDDIVEEIQDYPRRLEKIGGTAPDIDGLQPSKANERREEELKKEFAKLFGKLKQLSQQGQLQKAKKLLIQIKKKADNLDLSEGMRKQINNKVETAKHHLQAVKELNEGKSNS